MSLSFEMSYKLFQSTLPGGRNFFHQRAPVGLDPDPPDSKMIEVVRFHEFRLSTHVRRIGGWTFIAENRFLGTHVARFAKAWMWYNRGADCDRTALKVALCHCLKRFYAEVSLGEHNTRLGRTLLIEAVLLERGLLKRTIEGIAAEPALAMRAAKFEALADLLARYHEFGHYSLVEMGDRPEMLARGVLNGQALEAIELLVNTGEVELAEEALCDLIAFQAALDPDCSSLGSYDLPERTRIALFISTLLPFLSIMSFQARANSRAAARGEEISTTVPEEFAPVSDSVRKRMFLLQDVVDRYSTQLGFSLFGGEQGFPLREWPLVTLFDIDFGWNGLDLCGRDGIRLCNAEERRIADFLALGMGEEPELSEYLLRCSRQFAPDIPGD